MSEETEKYKFSIDKIFEAKEQYHKDIAALPLKEKYIIFLKLQKAVYETMKIAGKELEPGKRVWDVEEGKILWKNGFKHLRHKNY